MIFFLQFNLTTKSKSRFWKPHTHYVKADTYTDSYLWISVILNANNQINKLSSKIFKQVVSTCFSTPLPFAHSFFWHHLRRLGFWFSLNAFIKAEERPTFLELAHKTFLIFLLEKSTSILLLLTFWLIKLLFL